MSVIVIEPGFWTTVQDAGVPGRREWGVPPGGAFDLGSAELANALAGNRPDAAVLEFTLRGGVYEALGSLGGAIAGATIEATLAGLDGISRSIRTPCSFSLHAGDRLVLGRTLDGARAYLAVRGGFQTATRLGSRSSEHPLRRGDFLRTRESLIPARYPVDLPPIEPTAEPFRVVRGPDAPAGDLARFWRSGEFRVGSRSNRMGLRLEGPALEVMSPPDRLSAPVAPGAIQVAGGQLIVLGVAAGTMGGYPHVAHVASADMDRLAQLRPGDLIGFRPVSLPDARSLDREARQERRSRLLRIGSLAGDLRSAAVPRPEAARV
ncbi:KipI antagonist [Aquisphaera giovannonii]|uniref:KipI antagonist n=1 Tax=Aquisphaera giovannonii TaxID=406548 RepID=A0A5B9VXS8_9BACT|nr:biotin-dependent carboxyltransferase family protein [Aquisphaera giovannonii]QEH32777.1 KipI antagonist [Aquisphaera giovannonii]